MSFKRSKIYHLPEIQFLLIRKLLFLHSLYFTQFDILAQKYSEGTFMKMEQKIKHTVMAKLEWTP